MKRILALAFIGFCWSFCFAQEGLLTDGETGQREPLTDVKTRELVEGMCAARSQKLLRRAAGAAFVVLEGEEGLGDNRHELTEARRSYTEFQFNDSLSRSNERFYDADSGRLKDLRVVFVDNGREVISYRAHQNHVTVMDGAIDGHVNTGADFRPENMMCLYGAISGWVAGQMRIQQWAVTELGNGIIKAASVDGGSYVLFDSLADYMVNDFTLYSRETLTSGAKLQKGSFEYRQTSGGWYPVKVDFTEEYQGAGNNAFVRKKHWSFNVARLDADAVIDDSVFTMEKMGIKAGVPVYDAFTAEKLYYYGKGPLSEEDKLDILKAILPAVSGGDVLATRGEETGSGAETTTVSEPVSGGSGGARGDSMDVDGRLALGIGLLGVVLTAIAAVIWLRRIRLRS